MNPTGSLDKPVSAVPSTRADVVVVGDGAAGTLVALHLLRRWRARGSTGARPVVALVGPGATGRGVAYATDDPRHLLNVPAGRMSALPDDPDHLVRWARRSCDETAGPQVFLARRHYGRYLEHALAQEAGAPDAVGRLLRVPHRAVRVGARPDGRTEVVLGDGGVLLAADVVLALGVQAPGAAWAPPGLAADPALVADPWAPGALAALDGDRVLLVGTGLTMVDTALALQRPGRTLHAVSRHGLLPHAHAAHPVAPTPTALPEGVELDTPTLVATVERALARTVRAGGDWRSVVDGLRPSTTAAWQRLCGHCRGELLAHHVRRWEVLRHRVPRESAAAVGALRASGALTVRAASVAGARRDDAGLHVSFSDGSEVVVDHVVSCTGPLTDPAASHDPLLRGLLADGLAVPSPLALGLATAPDGRLVGADGRTGRLWTLGALRRGDLWETTAVPEIRAQAVALADRLAPPVPAREPSRRRPRDAFGLALSTTPEAAATYADALQRVLLVQGGAAEALEQAVRLDPGFAVGHAALALLGHEGGAPVDVPAALRRAQRAAARADERERGFVDVVTQRVQGGRERGARALLRHLERFPRDALAVSAAVPTIAFSGVTDVQQEAWDLVERLAPAYGDDWWFAGLLAFVRQDQGRYDEAAGHAQRGLRVEAGSGHAAHALAHVHYETGDHRAGLAWLDPWIAGSGRAASHRAHFSWHAALHELSLGDVEALRRRWEAELSPGQVGGVRALVDSASLLWRCRMVGVWPDEPAVEGVLAQIDPDLLAHPTTPFTALHAALALAGCGDDARLRDLRAHAAGSSDPVMRDVVVALCDALEDTVAGRWDEAARGLRLLGPWLVQLGGSAAQREIVEDTLLHVLVRARRCDEARAVLEERLDRRSSPLDRRRLAGVPQS